MLKTIDRCGRIPPVATRPVSQTVAGSRPPAWESRVGEQFAGNIHVHAGVSETEYVAVRTERDRRLNAPALLLPSLQVNICAGRLPRPQSNGTVYLRMPLDIPGSAL